MLQKALVVSAVLMIPVMLLGKPIYTLLNKLVVLYCYFVVRALCGPGRDPDGTTQP